MHFKIKEPIWSRSAIGLREDKLTDVNTVEILYKDATGFRCFPHTYVINKNKAMCGQVQYTKNVKLRIIPLDKFEIVKEV